MQKQTFFRKKVIIIGAGPAGLTAAYEICKRLKMKPIVLEKQDQVGGISRTIQYHGNRMDLGGHRFFSKSSRVMNWWKQFLPIQRAPQGIAEEDRDLYDPTGPDPELEDKVMLIRKRTSRIYYLRNFFDYPLSLKADTLKKLGLVRLIRIGISYIWSRCFPVRPEKSLADFFINRFGKELYQTFFKDYTEKVWGIGCDQISASWGVQRIKGLSISKAIVHALRKLIPTRLKIGQEKTETSLIERFLYPKFGPGQIWEEVAAEIENMGGSILYGHEVKQLSTQPDNRFDVTAIDLNTGKLVEWKVDYIFSSMPIRDLIRAMGRKVPQQVVDIAEGLTYRDFITAGLLVRKLAVRNEADPERGLISDQWIYIQERDVKLGRIQIFNNWSQYLVARADTVWLGLEYFCNENDELWNMSKSEFLDFSAGELVKLGLVDGEDILDGTVIKAAKTYPAYWGSYEQFDIIRDYTDRLENLFLIGRNGMHRYNNQDHSMLTALTAVDNLEKGYPGKDNIWQVNTESEYHEEIRD
ncbi:MAG: NAD(P)/FAD-dependent oxidoreductase [Candidatus Cloacimonetes bacterium]|nr:NAD(P)/FAD-dependent oxidoreductase [Candidatus Cloacimonadota bacterium]